MAVVWIASLILFKIAALANLGAEWSFPIYSVSTTLGLVLGLWAGFEVKAGKEIISRQ